MATFTVTGPDLEVTQPAKGAGLVRAITAACAKAHRHEEASFYVRDPNGDVVGRVDAFQDGTVNVWGGDVIPTD